MTNPELNQPSANGAGTDEFVALGKFAGAYGVKGWVRVASYATPSESLLLNVSQWISEGTTEGTTKGTSADGLRLGVLSKKVHGAGQAACIIVQLQGVATKEQADALRGREVGVYRSSFPVLAEADNYYQRDLLHLDVVNSSQVLLGKVIGIDVHGASEFLIVSAVDGGDDLLIPFVSQYITKVVLQEKRVIVDWELAWSRDPD